MRVNSRLTLNFGLRYEFSTMPVDIPGAIRSPLNLTDRAPTRRPLYQNPTLKNSARVSLRVDVTGDGKTSVSGGYGLYFNTNNQQNRSSRCEPTRHAARHHQQPTFPVPPFERGIANSIRPCSMI